MHPGTAFPALLGGHDILECNLDIYVLDGQGEEDEPFVVVASTGLDAVARRRIRALLGELQTTDGFRA